MSGAFFLSYIRFRNVFVLFQEIVGNLVEHMGSGFEGEIDAALDILNYLVNEHLPKMAPFAILVKVGGFPLSEF